MKCEIIRDLLPSYVDGLTSAESNEAIENHLEYCPECQVYLESMKKEITGERGVLEKDIDPFIRIKRETARKVVIAVILTAIISALGIEYYREYLYHGKSVMSDEVAISHEEDDNVKALKFRTYDENSIVTVGYAENEPVDGKMPLETISLIKYNKNPILNSPVYENEYRMVFLDEDTVQYLYSYPDTCDFKEDDFIAIKFTDEVKIIKMTDLREGNISSLK